MCEKQIKKKRKEKCKKRTVNFKSSKQQQQQPSNPLTHTHTQPQNNYFIIFNYWLINYVYVKYAKRVKRKLKQKHKKWKLIKKKQNNLKTKNKKQKKMEKHFFLWQKLSYQHTHCKKSRFEEEGMGKESC